MAIKQEYKDEFAKTMKIGLVSTIDDQGEPHITILSTIMAKDDQTMMLGEFVGGISKEHMVKRPQTGFLIMNLKKELWTGKMDWRSKTQEGPDYIMYNMQPKYRYNSYFGIHTVHYFNLVDLSEKHTLKMSGVILNSIKILLCKNLKKGSKKHPVMKPWSTALMKKMDTLKFISYIDVSGYPVIIPVIEAQAVSSSRIILSSAPYKQELSKIPSCARVAIFGLNLSMENVLLKGSFSGFKGGLAIIDIERVYNSMPPKMGYIYPPVENQAVTEF